MKNKILVPIVVLFILIPVLLKAEVWPFFRYDSLGAGASSNNGPIKCDIVCSRGIEWSKSSPVIDNNKHVYIQGEEPGTSNWRLWCVNTDDCSVNWTYLLGTSEPSGSIYSSCAIAPDNSMIYVGYLTALYAISWSGVYQWRYPTGGSVLSSPVIASDGTIYVGCNDNYLYAINPDSTLKWRCQTSGTVMSSPAIGSDGTIYVGGGTKLFAINPTGTIKWSYPTGGSVESSPAIGSDGTVYVGSWDYNLYAINSNGSFKWSYKTSGIIRSSPAIDNSRGVVFVGSDSTGKGYLNALDAATGAQKWKTLLGAPARYSSPAVALPNNIVYIGDLGGVSGSKFYEITGDSGRIICTNTHTYMITSPAIDEEDHGRYCVWYNEYSERIYKICYSDLYGTEEDCNCKRQKLALLQNEPNPFVSNTKISFILPTKTNITLTAYDISGRMVKMLAKGEYAAGKHTVQWDTKTTREGIYFCELKTPTKTLIRKMALIRN